MILEVSSNSTVMSDEHARPRRYRAWRRSCS